MIGDSLEYPPDGQFYNTRHAVGVVGGKFLDDRQAWAFDQRRGVGGWESYEGYIHMHFEIWQGSVHVFRMIRWMVVGCGSFFFYFLPFNLFIPPLRSLIMHAEATAATATTAAAAVRSFRGDG